MSHVYISPAVRRSFAPILKSAPRRFGLVAPLALGLAVLSTPGAAASTPLSPDPYEGFNRSVYNGQRTLDRTFLRPVSMFYRHAVPKPLRLGLKGISANLTEPGIGVNDALQGRPGPAGRTIIRFLANSTVGLGGLFDVASKLGLAHHENDFGLTLARRGVKSGPYLFLPLVGPTNARDGAAKLISAVFNPLTYVGYPGQTAVSVTTAAAGGLEARGEVDGDLQALDAAAVDPYATLRALAQQRRASDVRGGVIEVEAFPDFDEAAPIPAAAVTRVAFTTSSQTGAP